MFAGAVAGTATIVPEAATLLGWARDLGIEIPAPEARRGGPRGRSAAAVGAPTVETVVRALTVKGIAEAAGIATVLRAPEAEVAPVLEQAVAAGLLKSAGGMFSLTPEGKERGAALVAAHQEQWGQANAEAALDAFVPFDQHMKAVVTAWQMREVDGQQVINDHTRRRLRRRGAGRRGRPPRRGRAVAHRPGRDAALAGGLRRPPRRGRPPGRRRRPPLHRLTPRSTATTACGSNCTRT